jgi:flagellar hook assembly protein FlgD
MSFDPDAASPPRVVLFQNVPNPARSATRITYALPDEGPARLAVYDVAGRLVRLLGQGRREAGYHTVEWDGRTGLGEPAAGGIYFYRLETRRGMLCRKLLVTR